MFGADITHVRYLFSAEEWLVHKSHLIKQVATMGICIYWMSRQVMFGCGWEMCE
jgi:hypothetical protein